MGSHLLFGAFHALKVTPLHRLQELAEVPLAKLSPTLKVTRKNEERQLPNIFREH